MFDLVTKGYGKVETNLHRLSQLLFRKLDLRPFIILKHIMGSINKKFISGIVSDGRCKKFIIDCHRVRHLATNI